MGDGLSGAPLAPQGAPGGALRQREHHLPSGDPGQGRGQRRDLTEQRVLPARVPSPGRGGSTEMGFFLFPLRVKGSGFPRNTIYIRASSLRTAGSSGDPAELGQDGPSPQASLLPRSPLPPFADAVPRELGPKDRQLCFHCKDNKNTIMK